MNNQKAEKRLAEQPHVGNLVVYDVHSIFPTIQGEGPFCGTPCVFIRLAGCNLQCPMCDTQYTKGRQWLNTYQIVERVNSLRTTAMPGLVVITGGEPFRQDLAMLFHFLEKAGYYVQVESNGTLPPSEWPYCTSTDIRCGTYVVCSPKSGKVHPRMWEVACCVKYVMDTSSIDPADGLPIRALSHSSNPRVARPPQGWYRPIYLQPMDDHGVSPDGNRANIEAVKESCMKHGYILQLQIHKILGVE